MLAVASGQVQSSDARLLENALAAAVPHRSLLATIRHGVVIGAIATTLQIFALVALLYVCGIIAS
jgi:hypothetical protein